MKIVIQIEESGVSQQRWEGWGRGGHLAMQPKKLPSTKRGTVKYRPEGKKAGR